MKKLSGDHYLVLTILLTDINKNAGITIDRILDRLTNNITKKPCISRSTLDKILGDLKSKSFISVLEPKIKNEKKLYKIKDERHWGQGYTRMLFSSSLLRINKIINKQEYLVYIALIKRHQKNESLAYEKLESDLNLDKSNIGKYIRNLEKKGVIQIAKEVNEKGTMYNKYTFYA